MSILPAYAAPHHDHGMVLISSTKQHPPSPYDRPFQYDYGNPASQAMWMYTVPNDTMLYPLLLCRENWMRFTDHSYRLVRLALIRPGPPHADRYH